MPGLWGDALHKGDGMLDGLGLGEAGGVVAGGVAPAAAAAVAVGAATDTAGSRGQVSQWLLLYCILATGHRLQGGKICELQCIATTRTTTSETASHGKPC